MSQIGSGHPDFQDYVNWRGTLYKVGSFAITTVAPVNVAEYVTNFASLYLNVQLASGTGITITVNYYTDATLANFAGTFTWILASAPVGMQVIIPNLGNYVTVAVTTGQTGTQAGTLSITPTNVAIPSVRYPVTGNYQHGFSVNINASATLTAPFPYVSEGNGQGQVQCGNATAPYTIEIDELNEGANILDNAFRVSGVTGPQTFTWISGPVPNVLKITNTDTVAHSYTYHAAILGL